MSGRKTHLNSKPWEMQQETISLSSLRNHGNSQKSVETDNRLHPEKAHGNKKGSLCFNFYTREEGEKNKCRKSLRKMIECHHVFN